MDSTLMKCGLLLVAAVIVQLVAQSQAQDYCSEFGQSNTMCRFPEGTKGCQSTASGTDSVSIEDILSTHNKYRQRVAKGQESPQPSASNMNELVWDAQLAAIAQRWADQCTFDHDDNRLTLSFPDSVGQNIAYTGSSGEDSTPEFGSSAIKMWYDEVSDFSPSSVDPFQFSSGTGHYSQIVWAETYAIGCGFNLYPEGGMERKYYVCNYGPAGNMGGSAMYKQGTPCSECDGGTCSTKYDGLCTRSLSNSNVTGNHSLQTRDADEKYNIKNYVLFRV